MTAPAERLAVVLPAYDVASAIEGVLIGLRAAAPAAHVIVVDDGSNDGTAAVAAPHANVVLRHDRNRGKGAALRTGIGRALGDGATVVVTMDADGQHDPAAVPLLHAATRRDAVVIGARPRRGSAMPLPRRMSNALSSAVVSALAGARIADSQSGFRAIRAEVLRAVEGAGDRYDLETDFLVRAARRGFRVGHVSVPTLYGAPSHFRPVHDTLLLVRTMLRLGFAHPR